MPIGPARTPPVDRSEPWWASLLIDETAVWPLLLQGPNHAMRRVIGDSNTWPRTLDKPLSCFDFVGSFDHLGVARRLRKKTLFPTHEVVQELLSI